MKFYIALFAFYTAAGFVDAANHNKRNSSRRVELQKIQLKKRKDKKSGDNCTQSFYVETAEFESKDQLFKAGKPFFDESICGQAGGGGEAITEFFSGDIIVGSPTTLYSDVESYYKCKSYHKCKYDRWIRCRWLVPASSMC
jgi:hypothetical protein